MTYSLLKAVEDDDLDCFHCHGSMFGYTALVMFAGSMFLRVLELRARIGLS